MTKYHPELIREKFPWFRKVTVGKLEYFEMTDWGRNILDSYYEYKYDKCYRKFLLYMFKSTCFYSKFYDPIRYNAQLLRFLSDEKKFKQNVTTTS